MCRIASKVQCILLYYLGLVMCSFTYAVLYDPVLYGFALLSNRKTSVRVYEPRPLNLCQLDLGRISPIR